MIKLLLESKTEILKERSSSYLFTDPVNITDSPRAYDSWLDVISTE